MEFTTLPYEFGRDTTHPITGGETKKLRKDLKQKHCFVKELENHWIKETNKNNESHDLNGHRHWGSGSLTGLGMAGGRGVNWGKRRHI